MSSALRQIEEKRAVAEYTRLGRLKCIQFRPLPRNTAALEGTEAVRKTAHLGQHYAHCSSVGESGRRAWRFVDFLVPDEIRDAPDREAIEFFLRSIFRAVPLSCMNQWTDADLTRQFNRAAADGWLAHFETHAALGGFPVEFLLGIASRETNIRQIIGDGGHGFGLMQIDKRTAPEFCCTWKPERVEDSIAAGVNILTAKKKELLAHAKTEPWLTGFGLHEIAAAYNAGAGSVANSLKLGFDADRGTTGHDYGRDVLKRAEVFAGLYREHKLA